MFIWISFCIYYDDNKCMGDDNKCGDDNQQLTLASMSAK